MVVGINQGNIVDYCRLETYITKGIVTRRQYKETILGDYSEKDEFLLVWRVDQTHSRKRNSVFTT
jgi:hypothetical protein